MVVKRQPVKRVALIALVLVSCFSVMGLSRIELSDGSSIEAEILSEKPDLVFVDLGFTVLGIPRDDIISIAAQENGGTLVEDDGNLYKRLEKGQSLPVKTLVEQLGPSVLVVQTPTSLGSGFMIHPDGYLITNHHVIAGEHQLSVTVFETTRQGMRNLKKHQYDDVRIVATSPDWDLALLKIEGVEKPDFQAAPIGDSSALKQGQPVFAIGNPLGLERSVSQGIVSSRNRLVNGRLYVQTTAQINAGNSGGPLFNLKGEVVGVNNMKIISQGAEGLGFAIPAAVLRYFLENRDAFAFDARNANSGYRYNTPPIPAAAEKGENEN